MTKPLNMLVSWDRNIDPDKRVCSCAAVYSRSKNPASFHARLFFHSAEAAEVWARKLPKWVGIRIRHFPIRIEQADKETWMIRLDINMAGREASVSRNGFERYFRFMATVLLDNFKIDWQSPSYVPRAYGDRLAFEQALKPVVRTLYKDD